MMFSDTSGHLLQLHSHIQLDALVLSALPFTLNGVMLCIVELKCGSVVSLYLQ